MIHNIALTKRFDSRQRPKCDCCQRPKISTINRVHPVTFETQRLCIECHAEFMTLARLRRSGQRTMAERFADIEARTKALEQLNSFALITEKT